MVNVRISSLPEDDTPNASDFVAVDALSTRKTSIEDLVAVGRPLASQAEAETGTDPSKAMTPLTTAQAIDAQRPSGTTGLALLLSGTAADARGVLGVGVTGEDVFLANTAADIRALLDLEPGTDIQAQSAILQSLADETLTAGDILYATDATTVANLPIGADGEVLGVVSGVPAWVPSTVVSVQTYGAVGDGVADDSAAFAAALLATKKIRIPYTENGYLITSELATRNGQKIYFENGAKLVFSGDIDYPITIAEDGVELHNPTVDITAVEETPSGTASTAAILIQNAQRTIITQPHIISTTANDGGGGLGPYRKQGIVVDNSQYFQITGPGEILDINSTAVLITNDSSDGIVSGIRFGDTRPGLHILLNLGAHRVRVIGNSCESGGAELVGITYESYDNVVMGNIARNCEDAGYSISGYNNTVVGNLAEFCEFNGFAIFGRDNVITGNIAKNNGQAGGGFAGFSLQSAFGAIAVNNIMSGNYADDDQAVPTQQYLAKASGDSYAEWSAGVVTTSGTYRSYLDNLYLATNSATTGATPPTHTSGDVSDGAVTWRWVNSYPGGMQARNNVIEVRGHRFGTAAYTEDAWGYNRFNVGKTRQAATYVGLEPTAWSSGASVQFGDIRYVDVSENNPRRYYQCISASGTTGATRPTHTSGAASDGAVSWFYLEQGGEFQQITNGNRYPIVRGGLKLSAFGSDRDFVLTNVSPEGLATASPGSFALRNSGTLGVPAYFKETGTAATGWWPVHLNRAMTTTARQALSLGAGQAGFQVWDTTLGVLAIWSGTAWRLCTMTTE